MFFNTLPSIFCSIGLFFIPESPKYLFNKGRHEDGLKVLQKVYSMNTGKPKDTYPCEYINSDEKKEGQVNGISEKLKLMARQTISIFNGEHILKTLKFSFVAFFVTLVGAGLHMWLPPVLDYMTAFKNETLTVCDAMNLVRNQKANLTKEDKCMVEKDVTQFKIMFFINTSFLVFFVVTAALTTFVGGKLKTSLGRHVLKTSILGEYL